MPQRKPAKRVISINGNASDEDFISQSELAMLSDLQKAEWIASRAAQKVALETEVRIAHGARIEPGPLRFDMKLRMARSRKAGGE